MDEKLEVEMNAITIEDCIEMLKYKDRVVILSNGKVEGFEKIIPAQTVNQSGDK